MFIILYIYIYIYIYISSKEKHFVGVLLNSHVVFVHKDNTSIKIKKEKKKKGGGGGDAHRKIQGKLSVKCQ